MIHVLRFYQFFPAQNFKLLYFFFQIVECISYTRILNLFLLSLTHGLTHSFPSSVLFHLFSLLFQQSLTEDPSDYCFRPRFRFCFLKKFHLSFSLICFWFRISYAPHLHLLYPKSHIGLLFMLFDWSEIRKGDAFARHR